MLKYFCIDEDSYIRNYIEGYKKITWYNFQISDLEKVLGVKFTKYEIITVNKEKIKIKSLDFFDKTKTFVKPKEYPCMLVFGSEARNNFGYYYVDYMIIYPSDFEDGVLKEGLIT